VFSTQKTRYKEDGQLHPFGPSQCAWMTITYRHLPRRVLVEGAFTVIRECSGDLLFRRPDGKAVPACGFWQEDLTDDDVGVIVESAATINARDMGSENSREFSQDSP